VEGMIHFEWILPESQKDAQITAIEVAGGTVEESGSAYCPTADEMRDYSAARFEPLTLITAAASSVFIGQTVMKMWRDRRVQGGLIIDTRGEKLRIRPVPTMPSGRLIIVVSSGTKIVDKEEANVGAVLLTDILAKLIKRP
jgi:hypothetical protein